MKNWKSPPKNEVYDTAPLFAKMERVEGLALAAVEDEGDAGFNLLSLIVGWMAILQKRTGVAERRNRRAARKAEMLASEALRMNMCDRLGGVGALERWEERARERLAQSFGSASARSRVGARERGMEGRSERVREFALARMPGARKRRVTTRVVRGVPNHMTPISVWPCEIMPEKFAREWWKVAETSKDTDAFPESAGGRYPGSRAARPEGNGLRARDPVSSTGMRGCGRAGSDDGGPVAAQRHTRAGAYANGEKGGSVCAFV